MNRMIQDDALPVCRGAQEEKRRATADPAQPLRPEDSRYYHPTLNPSGAPPPGKADAAGVVPEPAKLAIP
eukprot:173929-Chlamydomonas_euryale.AAC.2